MSVWKRELFKWNRSTAKESKEIIDDSEYINEPLITIGNIDPNNADLKRLHLAAMHGRKKEVVTVLQSGIWIDFPNDAGQTALFVATLRGQYRTAEILLQNGANPNEKSDTGMTPVHAACLKANLRVLGAMLAAGGDLRLHDNEGNSCLDWARYDPSPRKRMKMMEFLQKAQLFALNYSGDFLGRSGGSLDRQPSILQMLRGKVGSQMSLDLTHESGLRRVHSHGYGRVYYGGDAGSGFVSVIPLVTENQLVGDVEGISFELSSHFKMISMVWNMTPVTVKRLAEQQRDTWVVDLLISEAEHISKLRHPNLLLMMGLCQTGTFDGVILVFERVSIGSLHYVLHEKLDHLPMTYIRDIACQVCQAMLYVHSQSYLHCSLTSHAVLMVTMHQAKLGCLEYMVESQKASTGRTCLVATSPHMQHFYRWMSPEIMKGMPPCVASDIFSFCCVLWEMITSEVPWKDKTLNEVLELHNTNTARLPLPTKSAVLFQEVTEQGLKPDPRNRPRDFTQLLLWLQGPLDKPLGWKPSTLDRVKTIQKESQERISFRHGIYSFFDSVAEPAEKTKLPVRTQQSSSSCSSASYSTSNPSQVKPRSYVSEDRPDGAARKARESAADATNNHSHQRPSSVADSWSTVDNSEDGLTLDVVDRSGGGKLVDGVTERRPGYKRMRSVPAALQTQSLRLKGRDALERSASSSSAVGRHQRYSRRIASVPWQEPRCLPRAGSVSPRLTRTAHASSGRGLAERSCKTLPPVKPASHATDLKEFLKGDNHAHKGTASLQTLDTAKRRKRKTSPRRSFPMTRNRPLRSLGDKHVTKSQSDMGEMMSAAAVDCDGGKDVHLSMPGSVRTLTEQFQAYMHNHSLRQSILKGSMTPQGTLFEDLDTSPTRLERSPNVEEVPPEGLANKDPENSAKDALKESNDSLTSVSLRDESTPDEEDEDAFPLGFEDELDVTHLPMTSTGETNNTRFPRDLDVSRQNVISRSVPVYGMSAEKRVSPRGEDTRKSANPTDTSQEDSTRFIPSIEAEARGLEFDNADNRLGSDRKDDRFELDHACDGVPRARSHDSAAIEKDPHNAYIGFEQYTVPFLPSCARGTDMSNHPFDFQDYYIDDDYTGVLSRDDDDHHPKRASRESLVDERRVADRSRPRTREQFWLDTGKKGGAKTEQQMRAEKRHVKENRTDEMQDAGEVHKKDTMIRKETWVGKQTSIRKETSMGQETWMREETSIRKEETTQQKTRKGRSPRGYLADEQQRDPGYGEAGDNHAEGEDRSYAGGQDDCERDANRSRENQRLGHSQDPQDYAAEERGRLEDACSYRNDATDSREETLSNYDPDEPCYRKEDQWLDDQLLEDYTYTYSRERQQAEEMRNRQRREERFRAASQWLEERFEKIQRHKREKGNIGQSQEMLEEEMEPEKRETKTTKSPRQLHAQKTPRDNTRDKAKIHSNKYGRQYAVDNPDKQDDGYARNEGEEWRGLGQHPCPKDDSNVDDRAADGYFQRTSSRKDDRETGSSSLYVDVDSPDGDQSVTTDHSRRRASEETGRGRKDATVLDAEGSYDQDDLIFCGNGGSRDQEPYSPQQDPDRSSRHHDLGFNRDLEHDRNPDLHQNRQQQYGCLPADSGSDLLYPELRAGYASRESSLSTVVERCATSDGASPRRPDDDDDCKEDDNDHTLVAAADDDDIETSEQRPCIILNLESSGQRGPQASTVPSPDRKKGAPCGTTHHSTTPSPPHQQTTLRRFYLGSLDSSQGYTTTLRVESSLERPGSHRITQTARDTGTGRTCTVHEETVQADTIRTTMGIQ